MKPTTKEVLLWNAEPYASQRMLAWRGTWHKLGFEMTLVRASERAMGHCGRSKWEALSDHPSVRTIVSALNYTF
jgi:hypothetical protein